MLRFEIIVPGVALALACGAFAQTGTTFCAANNNSTGAPAALTGAFGSGVGSDLHLDVGSGVPNEIGFFLVGNEVTSGVVFTSGLNCLVGTGTAQVFRYSVAGTDAISVGRFDSLGVLQNLVGTSLTGTGFDVPDMIPAGIPFPIMSGDTWHFQLWYRDTAVAPSNSNFSNGLSVIFDYSLPVEGMVLIPAGTFSMGSDAMAGDPYYNSSSQQPVHDVTISQDFWMGRHEVTQTEYSALIGSNPSLVSGAKRPVEQVSWNDAVAYCTALTAQEKALGNLPVGYEYRLPTEAEWEYACRAGTTTEFNVGADLYCADARFNYSFHGNSSCGSSSTVNVGSYPANAFGLHDMHGNVSEWCLDTYSSYSVGAVTDPFVTGGPDRVFRGGSWAHSSDVCRSAGRYSWIPSNSNGRVGFRVVLAPEHTLPVAGMVLIPAGTFSMGSDAAAGVPYNNNSEQQPVHDVTISQDFWMGEHEVTQAEYSALIGSNPSYNSGANLPVEQVSWNDAVAYCTALTAQEMALGNLSAGYEYRLPTEAEWEYACRAGTTTEFNVGADLYCADARFNYSFHANSSCGTSGTIDIGNYPANAFGLHDMHGNVSEWCLDTYSSYSAGAATDPFVTGGPDRVFRGGSWAHSSDVCRSAGRYSWIPSNSNGRVGFRVVLAPVLVP
ncbi:MAG: formylglycine-generating enzyme family protein [bacterium]|nr:formylglycine-generating enzyme family protein [bacterium]